jgi:hypothetical protein
VEAINRLENALVAKMENHLELEADDVPDSDEEVRAYFALINDYYLSLKLSVLVFSLKFSLICSMRILIFSIKCKGKYFPLDSGIH